MASVPRFYYNASLCSGDSIWLDEATAKHVVQVLRMQAGEPLELTDGKGTVAMAVVEKAEKKKCAVSIQHTRIYPQPQPALYLAVAFTKNASRNEWLLEKATELGISSIIPLSVQRSEREHIRYDRWKNILVSAMLQSQQAYLPNLTELQSLDILVGHYKDVPQKLVGHCIDSIERKELATVLMPAENTVLLIGPEGDFTEDEVQQCIGAGFAGVAMGSTRLRTETAAIAACAYFNMINYEKN